MIYSDTVFWIITGIVTFLETTCIWYVCDKKMQQMDRKERKAEEKRRKRAHDDYCTKEVERLYIERKYKEGFTAK